MMQKHLVMTVRAHARCDFALILRTARPESENQHHEVIEPEAPRGAVHPRQVIARPLAVGFAGERVSVVRSPEPAGGEVLLRGDTEAAPQDQRESLISGLAGRKTRKSGQAEDPQILFEALGVSAYVLALLGRAEADDQLRRALGFFRSVDATRFIGEAEALLASPI